MPSRSWVVDHAEFEGDSIDRDKGYPDLEAEVHPLGILTEKPTFQLLLKISGKHTILSYETAVELTGWLSERIHATDNS